MKNRIFLPALLSLLIPVAATAADTGAAKAAPAKPAAGKAAAGKNANLSPADRKALAEEERDRLTREKQEMDERAKLLETQLQTTQKLVAEKEAYLKQLQDELKALKAAPAAKPATKPAAADSKPAAGK